MPIRRGLVLLSWLVLFAAGEAWAGEPAAPDPDETAAGSQISVQLHIEQRLRRTPRGLKGRVRIQLTNDGPAAVQLVDPEIHGLIFQDPDGGELRVVPHPCQCVRDARQPDQARRIELAPGESTDSTLEEFGCGGSSWKAPPRGRYLLSYRIHGSATLPAEDADGSVKETLDRCVTRLQSETYWEGAFASEPVEIKLR